MVRLFLLSALLLSSCRSDPEPSSPSAPPPTPAKLKEPPPELPPPRATSATGGIVEPRTVTSSHEQNGEIREVHKRSDGSIALEAFYLDDRAVRLRAASAAGKETWECELPAEGTPTCIVRDPNGTPLATEALAARNYDARQRLEAARELLAPPGHEDDEHGGHQHSHFKVPPPAPEDEARWQAKRSKAWADAEPWFERVDALQTLGLPTLVATALAKEELSTGFWVVPKKAPIGPTAEHD